jgi:hypothetical protein
MKTILALAAVLLLTVTTLNAQEKKPWLAGTLSAVVPGLGHVYNGELDKAAYFAFFTTVYAGGMYAAHSWNKGDDSMLLMGLGFAGFKLTDVLFAINGSKKKNVAVSMTAIDHRAAVGFSVRF